jgi:hypothetical protein
MTKRVGTEILVSRACARIREEKGVGPEGEAKSELWAQVLGLRSDFPELTDDEIINVVVADYEPGV